MASSNQLSKTVYSLLIRLYPAEYRDQFGEEISAVFIAKLNDARQVGALSAIGTWLDELFELPGNILTEYWLPLSRQNEKGKYPMSVAKRVQMIGLFLPIGLAVFLAVINPVWILSLFSSSLGWLIVLGFLFCLARIVLSVWRSDGRTHGQTLLAGILALVAVTYVLFGPALVRLVFTFPADLASLRLASLIILASIDAGVLAAIVAVVARPGKIARDV